MRLLTYKYYDDDTDFQEISTSHLCLFVGGSGSGKSRLFNTVFNLGRFVQESLAIVQGKWHLRFSVNGVAYEYELHMAQNESSGALVEFEVLSEINDARERTKELVSRQKGTFKYEGVSLPKLSSDKCAISLLKDEPSIRPIYDAFGRILRRDFSGSDLDKACRPAPLPKSLATNIENTKSLRLAFEMLQLPLSPVLLVLKRSFPDKFRWVIESFKDVFPFVTDLDIQPLTEFMRGVQSESHVSIVLKEEGSSSWIPLLNFSSGMQKIMMMLIDLAVLQSESIYMIDEYENSLGVNAISHFPDWIAEREEELQFLITSHHPYLINNVPIKNWYVFGRKGREVKILHGKELERRYGTSKQQAFLQLINDPFFTTGEEKR